MRKKSLIEESTNNNQAGCEVDKVCVYPYTYTCYFRIRVLVIHDTWMSEKSASSLWVMGDLQSFHHFRPLVYFYHHARSPAVTYPGHAWLLVPPRKELRPRYLTYACSEGSRRNP
jgi:hypothetical protein